MSVADVLSGARQWEIASTDVLAGLAEIPSESIHMVCTSPPYWGLRNYGCEGQIGLEATPEEWLEKMVAVMREVKRVLRSDGTVFLNLGDSYSGSRKGQNGDGSRSMTAGIGKQATSKGTLTGGLPTWQRVGRTGNSGQRLRLRSDLSEEQIAYVFAELAKARSIATRTEAGL